MRHFCILLILLFWSLTGSASLGLIINGYVKSISAEEVIVVDIKTQKTITLDRKEMLIGDINSLFKKMDRKKVYNFTVPIKAKIKEVSNK